MLSVSQIEYVSQKKEFQSKLDEAVKTVPMGERVVIGVDVNRHVDERNRGDEGMLYSYSEKSRKTDGSGFCEMDRNGCKHKGRNIG